MSNYSLSVGSFVEAYDIKKLSLDSTINRDTNISNIEEKKNKLEDFGWLMPIVITRTGKILEGQNRYEAAKALGLEAIPVYVVGWVDEEDVEETRDVIISLNNGNKAWVQWDYIKSYKSSIKAYDLAYKNCVKYEDTLSNGVVVAAMFNIGSMNDRFKKGQSALVSKDKYEYLLETINALVVRFGKNQFPSQTLRTFVLWANKIDDRNIINYIVNEMKTSVLNGQRVADGDLGLKEWLRLKQEAYEGIKSGK